MGEKDVTEKLLEEQNDVFADIMNTLVFNGKQVIREEDLESVHALSAYKMAGKIHSQERDVVKAWKQGCIRIALCGLENQSSPDIDMPLRVIGYDGAAYRAQLEDEKLKGIKRYPVITLVLYFGKGKWKGPKNLLGRVSVPEGLEALVSDYRINVFEIGELEKEKVQQFRSDFQIVADYVMQMQQGERYIPSEKPMRHLEEVMDLMEALTKDKKYKAAIQVLKEIKEKGAKPNMRSALDEAVKETETRMRSALDEAVKETEGRMRSALDEAVKETEGRMRSALDEAVKETEKTTREEMAKAMLKEMNCSKEVIARITQLPQSTIEVLATELQAAMV